MKTTFAVVLAIVGAALTAGSAGSQSPAFSDEIAPAPVLDVMMKAADWQLANPSKHSPTDWTHGALYCGMMALSYLAPSPKYEEAMWQMGTTNEWKPGPRVYHADDHCVGQTYAELSLRRKDPKCIGPMRARFDEIMAKPKDDNLSFAQKDKTDRWSWCDALFMAPPAWLRMTVVTGDPKYLAFGNRLWWVTSAYLYDKEEHLYYRDDRYFPQREANGKKVFWSRGNGWVMGGLVRMLQFLPVDHPDRPKYIQQFKEMAAKVITLQQDDGLWRSSLLDPASYPLKETSGTGFYTYALAWGINEGLLDKSTYEPVVRKAWKGLVGCVQPDGKLVHVQPIGADPKKFDAESTEVYGVGAFLLAGSEIYRMAGGKVDPARLPRPAAAAAGAPAIATATAVVTVVPAAEPAAKIKASDLPPPTGADAKPRAWGRYVPERKDDVAWENDRIAYRMYGPALEATGEISSGLDVWVKRVRYPIIDRWYKHADYHKDHGEGLDGYKVGPTCGCGGTAIWEGGKLYFSKNWITQKFLANGPEHVSLELTYAPWDAAGRKVRETKRITLDLGKNLNHIESRFEADPPGPLTVAVGIVERPGDGKALMDKDAGMLTYWEPEIGGNGHIACAVIADPDQIVDIVHAEGHHLVLLKAMPGKPLVYYAGAGWSKGDFRDAAAWEKYVRGIAVRAFE